MTVRKKSYPLQKVTLNLRKGDFDWLRAMHGALGASEVIRELVMVHRSKVENVAAQRNVNLNIHADVIDDVLAETHAELEGSTG